MCYGNLNEPNYPAEKAERLAHKESFKDENLQDDKSNPLDLRVRRQKVLVEITDFDIATIEALHDLLLDNHGYTLDHITLTNARKLTTKMYEAFKST